MKPKIFKTGPWWFCAREHRLGMGSSILSAYKDCYKPAKPEDGPAWKGMPIWKPGVIWPTGVIDYVGA